MKAHCNPVHTVRFYFFAMFTKMEVSIIKAIIWDIGGVLFPVQPWAGEKPSLEKRLVTKQVVIDLYDKEKLSKEYLKEGLNNSVLDKLTAEAAYRALTEIDEEVFSMIKEFHGNYRQFALANEVHKWTEIRDHFYVISDYFEDMYISIHHGVKKPDPKFFQLLLDEHDLMPEECIFIDDREENVESASKLGIHGVWYKGVNDLKEQLKSIL